ncbi:MAG: HAMP domain-containing protein, partial [Deltaproteobacteria bacterium]|nr:HAMP domain-containing protein [Deltaproteobacteria bacterium]
MRRFNDISIKHKLTSITMATAGAVLLFACGSFLIYELIIMPRNIAHTLASLASVTGNSGAAALLHDDARAASETLAALRGTPNVLWAHIYRQDGRPFASYDRGGRNLPAPQCPMRFDGYRFHDNRVELCRAIVLNGQTLGAISLASDLSEMTDRLWSYGQIVLFVLFLSLGVGYLISLRVQQAVSTPVLQLAGLARRVSAEQNFSLRAVKQTEDEIGVLVDGFNAMLEQIGKRDRALRQAQLELELRVVELQREVGERKRAEANLAQQTVELKRSNAELEQFAYVASHDLQEPLRMVSSYTQLLAKRYRDKLDHSAMEFIDFAVDGVKRMQTLIQDLLQFSRVGSRTKGFEAVNCAEALETARLNLAAAIRQSGAQLVADSLPLVRADGGQLVQLFQNLLGNAIKYRGGRAPEIRVQCRMLDGHWQFSVKDNGIGIDPQFSERIFALFQRLHGKDEYEGTGIGLAICKKIVERHGGTI